MAAKVLPSLDINGMDSGYMGDGPKTIIPKSARVKFSTRLVENQQPEKIQRLVEKYVKDHMPKDVDYKLDVLSIDAPFFTDISSQPVKQIATILEKHFGNKTVFNRSGGSIPAAEMLQRLFQKPVVLAGFTLPDENLHAPNENIDALLFEQGIAALKKMFSYTFSIDKA